MQKVLDKSINIRTMADLPHVSSTDDLGPQVARRFLQSILLQLPSIMIGHNFIGRNDFEF